MAPKSKTPSFKDAHRHAFFSIAAVYRLVQFQGPSLDSVEDDTRFRKCVADLEKNIKKFQNVYQAVRPQLLKAKPRPEAVEACGKHGIFAFDLVSEICGDILRKTTWLVESDDCLREWQSAIRGSLPAFIVPSLDQLEHLNAMLMSEATWVESQQPNGGTDSTNDAKNWITISGAEQICGANKGVISRAAKSGEIVTNGQSRRNLRLNVVSFSQWALHRSPIAEPTPDPKTVIQRAREARQKRGVVEGD